MLCPLSPLSCIEILSPLFQPSTPPSSLSHFFLEGKKHKIRFFWNLCVSVEKKQEKGEATDSWELWEEKWPGPYRKSMIYINPAHRRQSWRPFESDHHSLCRSAGVLQTGNGFRKFTLLSGFSFFSPDGNEWIMMWMGFAECSNSYSQGGEKKPKKSIKCMLFFGNI